MTDYDKIISLKTNNPEYYALRAFTLEELNQYKKAVLDYDKAIELDETDYRMFYDRGNAYLKLENIEKACSDWKIAIEKGDPRKEELNERIIKNCG